MRLPSGARGDRLPEFGDRVAGAAVDIDHTGVPLGAIADDVALAAPRVDAAAPERSTLTATPSPDHRFGCDRPAVRAHAARRSSSALERGVAVAQAQLRQPRALAHQNRKRLRTDLGIERAVVTGLDAIEAARLVGDHAGEYVEPAGRAFRIGGAGDIRRAKRAARSAARCRRSRSPAPRRRSATISCSFSSSSRSATVVPGPGRKLARTR